MYTCAYSWRRNGHLQARTRLRMCTCICVVMGTAACACTDFLLSVCLSFCLSACLPAYLPACLPARPSVYLSDLRSEDIEQSDEETAAVAPVARRADLVARRAGAVATTAAATTAAVRRRGFVAFGGGEGPVDLGHEGVEEPLVRGLHTW